MKPTVTTAGVKDTKRADVLSALQRALDQLHTAASNVLSAEGEPEGIGAGVWLSVGAGDRASHVHVSPGGAVTVLPGLLPAPFSPSGPGRHPLVSLSARRPPGLPAPPP